jgi:hypothetical protein
VIRAAIPLADFRTFAPAASRTGLVRAGLAAALVASLAAAFLLARDTPRSSAILPSGTSPVVVLDLSWSTSSDYRRIGRTIADLAASGRSIGLVVFSDVPYEMFPPGTPARELRPLLRFFAGPKRQRAAPPWASSLSGGTRISAALLLARQMLHRDGIGNGSTVLVSDLGDSPNDRTDLSAAVVTYLRDGIPLRVVGIHPTPEDAGFFTRLLGSRPLEPRADGGPSVTKSTPSNDLQLGLLVAAAVFLVLLAVNEHLGAGLRWSREWVR